MKRLLGLLLAPWVGFLSIVVISSTRVPVVAE